MFVNTTNAAGPRKDSKGKLLCLGFRESDERRGPASGSKVRLWLPADQKTLSEMWLSLMKGKSANANAATSLPHVFSAPVEAEPLPPTVLSYRS